MSEIEAGQVREHHRTGLRVEVLRKRPKGDWTYRYVDEPKLKSERHMNASTLRECYRLVEDPSS